MDAKEIFAKRLAALRKNEGLTQLQLAEKLNYSDKAVSKWERGEAIPDIGVLIDLSNLFGVTIDSLVKEEVKPVPKKSIKINHSVITLLIVIAIIAAECVGYVIAQGANPSLDNLLYCFVYPLPALAIVMSVLSGLWFNKTCRMLSVTGIVWSILLDAFLLVYHLTGYFYWLVFIIGIPAQIVILLSFKIIRISKFTK